MSRKTQDIIEPLKLSPIKFLAIFLYLSIHVYSQAIQPLSRIHFGDVLEIKAIGFPEYDWKGTMNPEGFINDLPLVSDPIYALCKTEEELAEDVKKAYSKFIREPNVVVKIVDTSNRPIAVIFGAVKTPIRLRIKREVRLSEIIALAGGLTEMTSGRISIIRSKSAGCHIDQSQDSVKIDINITDLLEGKDSANPMISSGDMIEVAEAEPLYIFGAVQRAGRIYFRPDLSLTQAIASAGGITKSADGKIIIFRKQRDETKTIEVDLKTIRSGKETDIKLQPFDIVEVLEKGKRKQDTIPYTFEAEKRDLSQLPLRVIE